MFKHIKAMSTDKKKIEYILFAASKPLIEHLVRLVEFPNAYASGHWVKEVCAFCHDVPRLKGSNRYPSEKFIYTQLSSYNDVLDNIIRSMQDIEYDEEFIDADPEYVLRIVESYQKWLAHELSQNGQVSLAQVREKLHELELL